MPKVVWAIDAKAPAEGVPPTRLLTESEAKIVHDIHARRMYSHDQLPPKLRQFLCNLDFNVDADQLLDLLALGVTEDQLIETLQNAILVLYNQGSTNLGTIK